METKQTAVNWLMMQLPVFIRVDLYEKDLYIQAKAMEKEQIIDAWNDGYEKGLRVREEKIINPVFDAETYYNETYEN